MFGSRKIADSKSLATPPNSSQASAREVLRVWEGGPGQPVELTLRVDAFADSNGRVTVGAWGVLLADIARHVANAYQSNMNANPEEVLGHIRAAFDAEWSHPTDTPQRL
jgi:hypothetical protein